MPLKTRFHADVPVVRSRTWLLGWGFLFLIAALGCARVNVPFSGVGIKGSGVLKTEQRPVAGFSKIDASGAVKLEWQADDEPSLEAAVEDNLLPHLVTEVIGDTLKIYFNTNVQPTKDVVVKAASPGLNGLIGSGATETTLKGVHSDDFKLALSGSSRCMMSGQAKALSVECSGASVLKSDQFEVGSTAVATSGSAMAEVQAKGLKSVHQSGASNVTVSLVSSEELKIDLSGSSHCAVSGQVNKLTIRAGGAAAVHAAELKAQSVQVDLGGSSHVDVEAVQSITGGASGSASVRYHGSPTRQAVQTSGSASVQRK
ncbi:MAG: DUF2807 domain-containing protein [Planctomycetes bacterium]|nr:DUF2807 domain-containing protein [Planctomycetota bacterium]